MVKEVKSWREEKRRKVWESNTQSNKITQPWLAFYVLSVVPCTTESQSYHQVFHLPDIKSIMRTVSIFIENLAPKVTPSNFSLRSQGPTPLPTSDWLLPLPIQATYPLLSPVGGGW